MSDQKYCYGNLCWTRGRIDSTSYIFRYKTCFIEFYNITDFYPVKITHCPDAGITDFSMGLDFSKCNNNVDSACIAVISLPLRCRYCAVTVPLLCRYGTIMAP